MSWWNFGRRYKTHNRSISGEHVQRALEDACFQSVKVLDREFLLVQEKDSEEIVDVAWKGLGKRYHGNSAEFPDCDDEARICAADVLRECIRRGYPAGLPFGIAKLKRPEGGHLMCVAFNLSTTADGAIRFYEPQNRKWKRPSEMDARYEFEWALL